MARSLDQFAKAVLSGRDRSLLGRTLRVATALAEPPYAALISVRNRLYDHQLLRSHPLGRPTVSVGNLTAGGTGKTPVVRWLAEAMRQRGRRPAILLRGYMHAHGVRSDEAAMLGRLLHEAEGPTVEIEANPDRLKGAQAVLSRAPRTDRFILDDGFQHRRAGRDFDLVLIDAGEPFGFGHVHPRGLLREPLSGLGRADGILLTRTDAADEESLAAIGRVLARWNPTAPVFRSIHRHRGLLDEEEASPLPIDALADRRFIAFAGIGHPMHLDQQLRVWGDGYAGSVWFADHHAYTERDVRQLIDQARSCRAEALVTTAKDWIKMLPWRDLWRGNGLRLWRLDLAVEFQGDDESRLLHAIDEAMDNASADSPMPAH